MRLDEQKGYFGLAWVRLQFATFVAPAGVMLLKGQLTCIITSITPVREPAGPDAAGAQTGALHAARVEVQRDHTRRRSWQHLTGAAREPRASLSS